MLNYTSTVVCWFCSYFKYVWCVRFLEVPTCKLLMLFLNYSADFGVGESSVILCSGLSCLCIATSAAVAEDAA